MCFPFYKDLSGIIAELLERGTPHLRKLVNYPSEKFWLWRQRTSVCALFGGRKGIRCQPVGGRSMSYFLGGKSCDGFVQPEFFLAGNRARNDVAVVTSLLWELVFNYFIA